MSNFWREKIKCFWFNNKQNLSQKVTKKAAKLVPTTLNARAIFPSSLVVGSKLPPFTFWLFTFFPLCLRCVKSCGWARISNDLLESLERGGDISWTQVLVAKAFSLIEQADVILLTNFLCEKKRQTLNWGCRESAANVRITAWVLILVQVFVLVRLVGSSLFMLISASHPLQESPCLFVGSLLHLHNAHLF